MLFLVFYDISLFLMAYRVGYVQPCKISALIRPLYRTSPSIIPGGLVLYSLFDYHTVEFNQIIIFRFDTGNLRDTGQ